MGRRGIGDLKPQLVRKEPRMKYSALGNPTISSVAAESRKDEEELPSSGSIFSASIRAACDSGVADSSSQNARSKRYGTAKKITNNGRNI